MNSELILTNLTAAGFGPEIIRAFIAVLGQDPNFKFALREDLDGDKKFLPTRATAKSAGWDVRCAQKNREPLILRAGQYAKIPLGFRTIMPEGWWLELRPRSSTTAKKQCHCLYGVLDNDWRDETCAVIQYVPDISALGKDLVLNYGDAICQLVPVKLREMTTENISNQDFDEFCRNEVNDRKGGFGSTDNATKKI